MVWTSEKSVTLFSEIACSSWWFGFGASLQLVLWLMTRLIRQPALTFIEAHVRNCYLVPWWRHQMETFSALLALCAGNSPVTVNSPHKGQWRGALTFRRSAPWMNGWVNNREAGDLRRHRAHFDIIVMYHLTSVLFQASVCGGTSSASKSDLHAQLNLRDNLLIIATIFQLDNFIKFE